MIIVSLKMKFERYYKSKLIYTYLTLLSSWKCGLLAKISQYFDRLKSADDDDMHCFDVTNCLSLLMEYFKRFLPSSAVGILLRVDGASSKREVKLNRVPSWYEYFRALPRKKSRICVKIFSSDSCSLTAMIKKTCYQKWNLGSCSIFIPYILYSILFFLLKYFEDGQKITRKYNLLTSHIRDMRIKAGLLVVYTKGYKRQEDKGWKFYFEPSNKTITNN